MNFIKSTWRGEKSLAFTFWVMGVLVGMILMLLVAYLGVLATSQSENSAFLLFWIMFLLFDICYSVFSLVAIWRSADRYIANLDSKYPFWGYIARGIVALTVGRIIFELVSEFL